MKRARETVRTYAEEARSRLAPLPAGEARRAMEALCGFIADRTS
jgi:heptaprenyl diphosphate synthase